MIIRTCCLLGLLLLSPLALAHEYNAPATVQADAEGCFAFQAVFDVGPGDAVLGSSFVDGTDNTDMGALVGDYFCLTTLLDGETLIEDYSGCLLNPTQAGNVVLTLSTCNSGSFEVVVEIVPCNIPGIAAVPATVASDDTGAFSFTATYVAGCTGDALAGWEWLAVENVEPFGLVADLFCATPLAAGEASIIPVAANLIDPTLPGVVAVNIYPCFGTSIFLQVTVVPGGDIEFLRGDVDNNGAVVTIIDALFLLNFGFGGGAEPPCMAAADLDANGTVVPLLDTLRLLNFGFAGGPPPPPPFPTCGTDPVTTLTCQVASCP